MMKLGLCTAAALLACGCPGGGHAKYPQPPDLAGVPGVLARLAKQREVRTSFRVETVMDYWLGKDRVKGTVYVMGTSKRQVRFVAVKPDGNSLVDMACDGNSFTYVNFQENCQLAGACSKQSIATLLRVELAPDDFHLLAQGTVPILEGATGTVAWDADKGQAKVALTSAAGKQSITIDARDDHFDVIASELDDASGKVLWSVENVDFKVIKDEAGVAQRVPAKTRFKSPNEKADLLVEWKDENRSINLDLPAAKFTVPIPEGLRQCGGK